MGPQAKLSLILESPGGDGDCTFRMVRHMRQYAGEVEVLVVRWAKSAATMMSLGAETIFMGRDAELGPLDTQLSDPRGSMFPRSALNGFKALEYLRQYLLETLNQTVVTLMLNADMDIPYAIEAARPIVADIASPLFQQIGPIELGESRRHLAVGEEYSKLIMKRYSYKDLTEGQIEQVVRKLVWDYPSHSFVIDLEEAQEIGLNAKPLDDDTAELCRELLETVNHCTGFAPSITDGAITGDAEEAKSKEGEKTDGKGKKGEIVEATGLPDYT